MDVIGGLTRKSSEREAFLLFTFPSAFESILSALPEMQKASQILTGFPCRQEHRIIEPDLGGVGGGFGFQPNGIIIQLG
jgi:hypothetical protein